MAITEGQYGVAQLAQGQLAADQCALETPGIVRRLAIAKGADHEQGATGLLQRLLIHPAQRLYLHRQARGLQLPGRAPGQLFGQATLTGKTDQPALRAALGHHRTACSLGSALLAPSIQVEQPAGDEEQRHQATGNSHQDAPGQTEILADMQGIDAGQQLRLEALVSITFMLFDLASERIEA